MQPNVSINSDKFLCASGSIDLENVAAVSQRGRELIDSLNTVHVDLSGITHADSSTLAMLIDWTRKAKSQHKEILFHKMPKAMLDLGRVYGLDSILPVK